VRDSARELGSRRRASLRIGAELLKQSLQANLAFDSNATAAAQQAARNNVAPVQVQVTLRDRNQLTLPDRIADRIEAKPGDRLLLTIEPAEPGVVRLKRLRDSYAGIATGVYGRTAEERAAYVAAERDSWERGPAVTAAAAPDGTPYLTFEESRRTYWQTDVTRERYDREPKLRWPKCETCGRSIARMREHVAAHRSGTLDARGVHTGTEQKSMSRRRVAKWRASSNTVFSSSRSALRSARSRKLLAMIVVPIVMAAIRSAPPRTSQRIGLPPTKRLTKERIAVACMSLIVAS